MTSVAVIYRLRRRKKHCYYTIVACLKLHSENAPCLSAGADAVRAPASPRARIFSDLRKHGWFSCCVKCTERPWTCFCVALCQVDPLFAPARIDVCLTCSTQLKTRRKICYSGTLPVAINIIGVELPHTAHTMRNKVVDSSYILNFYCVIPPEDIRWFLSFIFKPNYLYMWRH